MKSGVCLVNQDCDCFALIWCWIVSKTPIATFRKEGITKRLNDYVQHAAVHFQIGLHFSFAKMNSVVPLYTITCRMITMLDTGNSLLSFVITFHQYTIILQDYFFLDAKNLLIGEQNIMYRFFKNCFDSFLHWKSWCSFNLTFREWLTQHRYTPKCKS